MSRKIVPITNPTKPNKLFKKGISLLIVVGLSYILYLSSHYFVMHFPYFNIKQISIINQEGEVIDNSEDFLHLGLNRDLNLFSLDLKKTAQDIRRSHRELQDVIVRRQLPDKLLIILEEREIVGVILQNSSSPGRAYLLGLEGFILPFRPMDTDLPKIVGIRSQEIQLYKKTRSLKLNKVLELLKELKKANIYPEYKVSRINANEYSNIIFFLEDSIKVKMGQGGFGRKAALLNKILAQLKASKMAPKYIDMRFDNPVVKP